MVSSYGRGFEHKVKNQAGGRIALLLSIKSTSSLLSVVWFPSEASLLLLLLEPLSKRRLQTSAVSSELSLGLGLGPVPAGALSSGLLKNTSACRE